MARENSYQKENRAEMRIRSTLFEGILAALTGEAKAPWNATGA
jgi:hypothetical protein